MSSKNKIKGGGGGGGEGREGLPNKITSKRC